MINIWKNFFIFTIAMAIAIDVTEARPQNTADSNQNLDTLESDVDEMRTAYYELPLQQQQQQNVYPSIPLDRLQFLIAHYNRPTAYLRSTSGMSGGGMNELYRIPESKRQVRYRQCYFNPISCFKK